MLTLPPTAIAPARRARSTFSLAERKASTVRPPNVRLNHEVPKWSYVQALLSRGDRRVGDLLETVHRLRGDWQAAFRESPLNPDFYVTRQWGCDEPLPWDVINQNLPKDFMVRENRRYWEAAESASPIKTRKKWISLIPA